MHYNSITLKGLRAYYGEYFYSVVRPWRMVGFNPTLTTAYTKYPQAIGSFFLTDSATSSFFYMDDTPVALSVSSSDASDALNNSGAGILKIEGLSESHVDSGSLVTDGGKRQAVAMQWRKTTEYVELNGQTAVRTIYKYRCINKLSIERMGSTATVGGLTNTGTIYIGSGSVSSGVNAIPWAKIDPNEGESFVGLYGFGGGGGKRLYITSITVSPQSDFKTKYGRWAMWHSKRLGKEPPDLESGRVSRFNTGIKKVLLKAMSTEDSESRIEFEEPYIVNIGEVIYFTVEDAASINSISVLAEGFIIEESNAQILETYKPAYRGNKRRRSELVYQEFRKTNKNKKFRN